EFVFAIERLVIGDDPTGVGGHTAHDRDQAGLGAALALVVRLVLAYGLDQLVPFNLIGVWLVGHAAPDYVRILGKVLALVNAAASRRVRIGRDHASALG